MSFWPFWLYEINMDFCNAGLIFTPEVYILYKKTWVFRVPEAGGHKLWNNLYNLKFLYRQVFTKTRDLHFTYVFPDMSDDLFLYIQKFIIASIINPSCEYLGRVLTKRPVVN